jgi:FlaA1/EpsC-like NDP-sugar epimerase
MLSRARSLPRPLKRALMILADAVLIPMALWLAFVLKHDSLLHGLNRDVQLYLGATVVSVALFWFFGLYRSMVRYIGTRAVFPIGAGVLGSAFAVWLIGLGFADHPVRLTTAVIFALIALVWVVTSRYLARWILLQPNAAAESVAVYGAGEAGVRLSRALNVGRGLSVVAFVDDKAVLHGSTIDSVPIYSPTDLPDVVRSKGISRVLLAVPSASRRRRAEMIRQVEGHGVMVQTIPNLAEIASGNAQVDDLREIDVSDLLGRDPVPPNLELLDACIRGKNVMVTGAGGSIGSELCRQILRLGPHRLVLFEASELALYNVERELRMLQPQCPVEIVALLGNAHHGDRAGEIIASYAIQTVYHAAAYKHVPIVEQNVVEGLHNNVISTWHMAEAALANGVETFVLISTDKAVNPANVMGATKRFAEIVLQGMTERGGKTRFCMVRFGNVLESSGSVVPLFRDQIRRGGPVTVTHRDVIRYFMTIPEAAQLVLQAGSMAKGGDVFVLDMGKPMRIDDLARRMVRLSGLTVRDDANPDGDIEITYTGLRPAEKLFEELLIGNNVSGTGHPMIMRAMEHCPPWSVVHRALTDTLVALSQFDVRHAQDLLIEVVHEYKPAGDIQDLVWKAHAQAAQNEDAALAGSSPKVTRLPSRRGVTAH